MKRMAGLLLMFGLCLSAVAADADLRAVLADPAARQAAAEAGRKAAFFCVNCHGENGVSKLPEVPNLAGQNPAYLLEQIRKFGAGQRRDEFMQGLIKVLKEEERLQIAVFYAGQTPPPGQQEASQIAAGRLLYDKLCARCHGSAAHGSEVIPRLAGQHVEYLVTAVTRYRDRTGERLDPAMSSAVAPLKNADIKAVAAYLNSLP
ncbi:MAG: c-type cytochrome [Azovibrio sp.]|nr:c-type cytochrome [Azovibrio sp.]